MPDNVSTHGDLPINFDVVRDELGRVPVMGAASDQELFFDLPAGWLAPPHSANLPMPAARELLSHDFADGI